jgi:recombinational DNA repair protein (RecF pathway)
MQTIDSAIILGKNQVKNNNHVVKVFTRKNGIQAMYVSQAAKKKISKKCGITTFKYLSN